MTTMVTNNRSQWSRPFTALYVITRRPISQCTAEKASAGCLDSCHYCDSVDSQSPSSRSFSVSDCGYLYGTVPLRLWSMHPTLSVCLSRSTSQKVVGCKSVSSLGCLLFSIAYNFIFSLYPNFNSYANPNPNPAMSDCYIQACTILAGGWLVG